MQKSHYYWSTSEFVDFFAGKWALLFRLDRGVFKRTWNILRSEYFILPVSVRNYLPLKPVSLFRFLNHRIIPWFPFSIDWWAVHFRFQDRFILLMVANLCNWALYVFSVASWIRMSFVLYSICILCAVCVHVLCLMLNVLLQCHYWIFAKTLKFRHFSPRHLHLQSYALLPLLRHHES